MCARLICRAFRSVTAIVSDLFLESARAHHITAAVFLALLIAASAHAQQSLNWTTEAGVSPLGTTNGPGTAARFIQPVAVAADASGNIYVADSINNVIRKITPAGVVSDFAGAPFNGGNVNGTGSAARFNGPNGIAVDETGN